jgi:hypothetical protein
MLMLHYTTDSCSYRSSSWNAVTRAVLPHQPGTEEFAPVGFPPIPPVRDLPTPLMMGLRTYPFRQQRWLRFSPRIRQSRKHQAAGHNPDSDVQPPCCGRPRSVTRYCSRLGLLGCRGLLGRRSTDTPFRSVRVVGLGGVNGLFNDCRNGVRWLSKPTRGVVGRYRTT